MTRCVVVDYKDDRVARHLHHEIGEVLFFLDTIIGKITSKIVGLLYIVTWPQQPALFFEVDWHRREESRMCPDRLPGHEFQWIILVEHESGLRILALEHT